MTGIQGWRVPKATTVLSADAARRCLRAAAEIGGTVLIIDAKNARAVKWYAGYGVVSLISRPLTPGSKMPNIYTALLAAGFCILAVGPPTGLSHVDKVHAELTLITLRSL